MVFVAIAGLVLIGFLTFVVDYGILWTARSQAQASADAGALAGAVGLAYDDSDHSSGVAEASAENTAQANQIWGVAPLVQVSWDCPDVPAGKYTGGSCVRVNVYRGDYETLGSTFIPSVFGRILGITSQRVRATATAIAAAGNATDCLRPFAVPDLYTELSTPANDEFNPGVDSYSNPGYTLEGDLGTELILKSGPGSELSPGWFRLIDVGSGAASMSDLIHSCDAPRVENSYGVDDVLPEESGVVASLYMAVEDLIALDPDAEWDAVDGVDDDGDGITDEIANSCVATHTCRKYDADGDIVADPTATVSPRVMALPVFDPEHYVLTGEVKIVNIYGFFIDHLVGHGGMTDVYGRIVTEPGLLDTSSGSVDLESAFLKVIQLIR